MINMRIKYKFKSDMNKISIMNKIMSPKENVLIHLADWKHDENNLKHQIGFLAQNLLDNSCMINFLRKNYRNLVI